mmetsp:Transcript_48129/g.113584  ORF Transcript_48129/g.113584 Transcript_48129/m.113584 type:complete len:80 (-) Transcript_48129:81-320(-)
MKTFPRAMQSKLFRYFAQKETPVKATKPWRSANAKEKHLRELWATFDVNQKMATGPFAMSKHHSNEFLNALGNESQMRN